MSSHGIVDLEHLLTVVNSSTLQNTRKQILWFCDCTATWPRFQDTFVKAVIMCVILILDVSTAVQMTTRFQCIPSFDCDVTHWLINHCFESYILGANLCQHEFINAAWYSMLLNMSTQKLVSAATLKHMTWMMLTLVIRSNTKVHEPQESLNAVLSTLQETRTKLVAQSAQFSMTKPVLCHTGCYVHIWQSIHASRIVPWSSFIDYSYVKICRLYLEDVHENHVILTSTLCESNNLILFISRFYNYVQHVVCSISMKLQQKRDYI